MLLKKIKKSGHLKQYIDVFEELEELGVISPLTVHSGEESKYKWIPHRTILRTGDAQVKTTKVRPEFNCSLKVENTPSLNEAAFPGIYMLNPLLGLLNHFRTNRYVLLADLKKQKKKLSLT